MTNNRPNPKNSDASLSKSLPRRRFVRAAGAAGITGLAGCVSGDEDAGQSGERVRSSAEEVIVQWAVNTEIAENADLVIDTLRNLGLSEDIQLELIDQPPYSEGKQRYQTWFESGREEPDLLNPAYNWVMEWAPRGYLEPLDEYIPETVSTVEDEYFEPFVRAAKYDDTLTAMPFFPDFPVTLGRKDLFEEAGYSEEAETWPTDPPSFEEFTQVVHDVQQQTGTEYGYMYQANGLVLAHNEWLPAVHAYGGSLYGGLENELETSPEVVGDRPVTIDEEPVVQATQMMESWTHETLDAFPEISPEAVASWDYDAIETQFMGGNGVITSLWPFWITVFQEEYGDDLLVMPEPYGVPEEDAQYDGLGGPKGPLGGWMMAINSNSTKKEAAAEVLQYLTRDEFHMFQFDTFGFTPPAAETLTSEAARDVDVLGDHVDTLALSGEHAIPYPVSPVFSETMNAIAQQIGSAIQGQKPSQEAVAELEEQVSQIENNYQA